MSLEARVNALDHAFHENNKLLEATHGVVSLILNEQREKFRKVYERFDNLEQKGDMNQQENRNRFDKIEETLIQIVNHLTK